MPHFPAVWLDLSQGWVVILGLTFWVTAVWVGLKGYRWFRDGAASAQSRIFTGSDATSTNSPGRVEVKFTTYYGFLAFVQQTTYCFWADPTEARRILWELHRFNCTWGLLAYGALFIPAISWINYISQKRQIDGQQMPGNVDSSLT